MAPDPALSVVGPDDAARRAASIKRLLARGTDIELRNGDVLTVVLTARELALIELEYGSLLAYMDLVAASVGGKVFNLLAFTLGMLLRQPADRMWDLIDTRRLREYTDALAAALTEAMPPMEEGAEGNGDGSTTTPSPGNSSSSSSSPSSTSPQPSSGV